MPKTRVLEVYDNKAIFKCIDNSCTPIIVYQGKDGKREIRRYDQTSSSPEFVTPYRQLYSFEAIFGFYDLPSGSHVALMTDSVVAVTAGAASIRRGTKFIVVPLFSHSRHLTDEKRKDEEKYLQLLWFGFSEHKFLYSENYELTLTQQQIAKIATAPYLNLADERSAPNIQEKQTVWSRADERFFWNRTVIEDLFQVSDDWIVPFVSGHVEYLKDCTCGDSGNEKKFSLLFISRRSRYRQGCRFTKRGIDSQGNVANFVETEQILIFPDGRITSYVQIRGSIPLRWSSFVTMKYEPKVTVDGTVKTHVPNLLTHFENLKVYYGDKEGNATIICCNLIDTKKDQLKLGTLYDETVKSSKITDVIFHWFDFHKETKKSYSSLSKLVDLIDKDFQNQMFFCRLADGKVTSWQRGVVRTNCMDNLDRTNVAQSIFARRSILMQLGYENRLVDKTYHLNTFWTTFERSFKTVWAHNADAISLGYAGTGALKVDFTKTGKRTLKGMVDDGRNSIMRYYINNFRDGYKQDAIDLMLGNYKPDINGPSPFQTRPGQETLEVNVIKGFVLLLMTFSVSLIVSPYTWPFPITSRNNESVKTCVKPVQRVLAKGFWIPTISKSATMKVDDHQCVAQNDPYLDHLQYHLIGSIIITIGVILFVMYKIVKKGSKIGERLVIHPQLLPEN